MRDLGNAVTLVACADPRPAIAVRALFDLSDAARYGRGRPGLAAGILGFAALGAAGLLARRGLTPAFPPARELRVPARADGLPVVCLSGGTAG